MSGWLLDTNVLSELRRRRPEQKVFEFIAAQPLERLHVSVVTLAEVRFGIEQLPEPPRRSEQNEWLTNKVRPIFDQRVPPITQDIMLKWRLLGEEGRKAGHTCSQPDLIIAATGLHFRMTIVSRDTAEYREARAPVFNPWTEPMPDASGARRSRRK